MTALARSTKEIRPPIADESNAFNHTFVSYLPAVETHARIAFQNLPEVEKEEAVAEAVAGAYCNYVSVTRRRKAITLKPSMLARYAVLHVKDGRHVGGARETKRDVLSWRAARHRRFVVHRLHGAKDYIYDCLSPADPPVWRCVLLEDRQTPVPDQVAFRIDWSAFLSGQTDRTRRIIAALASGNRRCEVAETFGLSPSTLTEHMARVRREWFVFQGTASETVPAVSRAPNSAADRRNGQPGKAA